MADIIELKATDLAAMLCSRVCHDLINPIGAIGNGLEVLADPTQENMASSARDLIASAAKQSRAKLEFARLAYGASSTAGTDIDTRECERVARLFFEIEKAELDWQVPLILLPKHKAKLLMNLLLIAAGAVPRGGLVTVKLTGATGQEKFEFTSKGDPEKRQKTLMPSGAAALLAGNPEEGVDARGIQPFYAGLLARLTDMDITIGLENEQFFLNAAPAVPKTETVPTLSEAGSEAAEPSPEGFGAPTALNIVPEPFSPTDEKSA